MVISIGPPSKLYLINNYFSDYMLAGYTRFYSK